MSPPALKPLVVKKASLLTSLRSTDVPVQASPPVNSLNVSNLEPGTYSIQFNTGDSSLGFVPLVEATIVWKVAGQSLSRRISVLDGTIISGLAEGVSVSLKDVTMQFYAVPPVPQPYDIMVTLCKGVRPTEANPPVLYTENQVQINPGFSHSFPLPFDSGVMAYKVVGVLDDLETNFKVAKARCSGASPVFFYYPMFDHTWIPITPGANRVIVNCDGTAVGAILMGVIWAIEG